ncbi:MAG: Cache 3/Cache 2 fusion domain-containing protein [Phormidium sp. BM_Day4_Bin.17]|nr:Cache 3/Cache 2 fusion domain-containing protein [Phormidium sp. BM_Day4_Bin.17]UCJ13754.1 MAG: Cache 3/Cache 2 fusion domain-containing protein [Phormidium sp. PBR-2020]
MTIRIWTRLATPPTTKVDWLVRGCLVLSLASFLGAGITAVSYWRQRYGTIQTALNSAQEKLDDAVLELNAELEHLETTVQGLAEDLSSGELRNAELEARLEEILRANPSFSATSAAYEPYAFSEERELFHPNFKRLLTEGVERFERFDVEEFVNYIETNSYRTPLLEGAQWSEPALSTIINSIVVEYSVPFTLPEPDAPDPSGIVYANYDLDQLRQLFQSFDLGTTGYPIVITSSGQLIYHPILSFVQQRRSIFDLAQEFNDSDLEAIAQDMISGESGVQKRDGGAPSWMIYQAIPSTDWSVGVVLFRDDIFSNTVALTNKLTLLSLLLMSGVVFALVVALPPHRHQISRLWLLSMSVSGVLALGLLAIWLLEMQEVSVVQDTTPPLVTETSLQQFLERQREKNIAQGLSEPITLPTGVFLQSMEFKSANDFFVTGYIWQRYDDDLHEGISRGFVLPEAIAFSSQEAYRQDLPNGELIGWYFQATLRQTFDYSKYPFDSQQGWLRIWPQDFASHVMLTPDLGAYDLLVPLSLPGLEVSENMVLPGWNIKHSFFRYRFNSYNSNFGFLGETQVKDFPELYFEVDLERDLLMVIITKMMRVIVVSGLLFGVQYLVRYKTDDNQLGFSASGVIGASGGFSLGASQLGE